MAEPERLSKRVAAMVPCSRSEAEAFIEGGFVRVDGRVVDVPQHRVGDERVEIDPKANAVPAEPVTIVVNKPAGVTSEEALASLNAGNHFTEAGHGGAPRILKRHFLHQTQLLPLPTPASGLIVFSQMRGVIRHLTEDALTTEQELIVQVDGKIADYGLVRLAHGLKFEGRALPPIKVSWQNETRLRFALKGIAPDFVPWMCEQVGLRVTAAKRIRIGRFPMAGLPEGRWRFLAAGERF
ncbi:S4 domain-containing protein [Caenimonas aquaedulcis]|uniref:Dual-specificity RNA pseudouridine synthase RluF n=1 Tax=Caenimonas aquaedulcis TaxID=2793270 RepID=A0A931H7Q9_9BURK|nr:S4 domain-containing protein [Caenimonas aquaedulcis]MBG9389910.1 RNA-binding protein [Caenimonas aquaedulcis]